MLHYETMIRRSFDEIQQGREILKAIEASNGRYAVTPETIEPLWRMLPLRWISIYTDTNGNVWARLKQAGKRIVESL